MPVDDIGLHSHHTWFLASNPVEDCSRRDSFRFTEACRREQPTRGMGGDMPVVEGCQCSSSFDNAGSGTYFVEAELLACNTSSTESAMPLGLVIPCCNYFYRSGSGLCSRLSYLLYWYYTKGCVVLLLPGRCNLNNLLFMLVLVYPCLLISNLIHEYCHYSSSISTVVALY